MNSNLCSEYELEADCEWGKVRTGIFSSDYKNGPWMSEILISEPNMSSK